MIELFLTEMTTQSPFRLGREQEGEKRALTTVSCKLKESGYAVVFFLQIPHQLSFTLCKGEKRESREQRANESRKFTDRLDGFPVGSKGKAVPTGSGSPMLSLPGGKERRDGRRPAVTPLLFLSSQTTIFPSSSDLRCLPPCLGEQNFSPLLPQ